MNPGSNLAGKIVSGSSGGFFIIDFESGSGGKDSYQGERGAKGGK